MAKTQEEKERELQLYAERKRIEECLFKRLKTSRKEVEERVINEFIGWGLDEIMTQEEKKKLLMSILKKQHISKKLFLENGVHNWSVFHFERLTKADLKKFPKNSWCKDRLKELEKLSDFEALDFPTMTEVHIKFNWQDPKQKALLDYLKTLNLNMVEV